MNVVNGLEATGIPGNILSTTPLVGHWPSTLTTRTTYDPAALGGNSYAASQVIQGETAEITMANRITVTNGLVGASLPGVVAGDFSSSPLFGAFNQNIYQPMFQFPTASFEAEALKGPVTLFAPAGSAAPTVTPVDNSTGFTMTFSGVGANLTETVMAVPGTPTINVTFQATEVGANPLSFVQVRVVAPTNISGAITYGAAPGLFDWYTNTTVYGNYSAIGTVSPASALTGVIPYNFMSGAVPVATLHANASNAATGASEITLSVSLTSPSANNIVKGLGPYLLADQAWQGWSIRFVMLFSASPVSRPLDQTYYQTEYGATLVAASGPYGVVLLPSPYGGPSYFTANG